MLYDPKWEARPNIMSLRGLVAWLEQQPPETTYDYVNPYDCLLCRYFLAHGYSDVSVALNTLWHSGGKISFPDGMRRAAITDADIDTYGAALKRANSVLC